MPRKAMKRIKTNYKGLTPDEILSNYPEKFLVCRGNHNWPRRAMWRDLSDTVREKTIVCTRCGYTKINLQDRYGNKIMNEKTRHPRGYLTPGTGLKRGQFVALRDIRDYEMAKIEGRVRTAAEGTVTELRRA